MGTGLNEQKRLWIGHYGDITEWFIVLADSPAMAALEADEHGPVDSDSIRPLEVREFLIGFKAQWSWEMGTPPYMYIEPNEDELEIDVDSMEHIQNVITDRVGPPQDEDPLKTENDLEQAKREAEPEKWRMSWPDGKKMSKEEQAKIVTEYREKVMGEKPSVRLMIYPSGQRWLLAWGRHSAICNVETGCHKWAPFGNGSRVHLKGFNPQN